MGETTLDDVKRLVAQLTPDEQIALVEYVARHLRQFLPQKQPQDLYGVWRDRFPADFDLDAALQEVRHEWEQEWTKDAGP